MHLDLTPADIDRFWSKVNIEGDDDCWLWNAAILGGPRGGYGLFHSQHPRRMVRAHVVAYHITYGPSPEGLFILHKCPGRHERACVNPRHLYAGTRDQNSRDMIAQGTYPTGSQNGHATLSEADIPAIRALASAGSTHKQIAKLYGVKEPAIWKIVNRHTWRHVPDYDLADPDGDPATGTAPGWRPAS